MTDDKGTPGTQKPFGDKINLESAIGSLLARLIDAETSLKNGRPADLDFFDDQVEILVEQVKKLPREEARLYVAPLQDLIDRLDNLEVMTLANDDADKASRQEHLPEEPNQSYNGVGPKAPDSSNDES